MRVWRKSRDARRMFTEDGVGSAVKNCSKVRKMGAKKHLLDLAAAGSLAIFMGIVSIKRWEKKPDGRGSGNEWEKRESTADNFFGEYCPRSPVKTYRGVECDKSVFCLNFKIGVT